MSPNPPRLPVDPRAQQVKREFQAELRAARRIVIVIAVTFILITPTAGLYLLVTTDRPLGALDLVAFAAPVGLLALIGLPFAIPYFLRLRAAERRRPARSMTRFAAHPQRRVDNRLEATGLEAVAATGTRDILLLTAEGSRQVELDVPRWAQDARIDLYVPVVTGMPAMATLVDEHWLAALRYPEMPEVEVQEDPMTDADWAQLSGSVWAAALGVSLLCGASLVVLVAVALLLGLPLHEVPWALGMVGGSMVGLGLLASLGNPQLRALRWRRSPHLCKRSYRGIATEVLLTSRRMASHRRSETHVRAWVRFGGGHHRQGDQWHWVGNWTDGDGAEADLLLDCVTVGEPMTVTYLYKNGRRKIRLQPQ